MAEGISVFSDRAARFIERQARRSRHREDSSPYFSRTRRHPRRSFPRLRKAVTLDEIAPGSNGFVEIWRGDPTNSGPPIPTAEQVLAAYDWITDDKPISVGKRVWIVWMPDEVRYTIIAAECENI